MSITAPFDAIRSQPPLSLNAIGQGIALARSFFAKGSLGYPTAKQLLNDLYKNHSATAVAAEDENIDSLFESIVVAHKAIGQCIANPSDEVTADEAKVLIAEMEHLLKVARGEDLQYLGKPNPAPSPLKAV